MTIGGVNDGAFGRRKWLLSISSAVLIAATGSPVVAQEAAPAESELQNDPDAIVVTALRRETSLMAVPLSIQASTGAQLMNNGIRDLTALKFITPGFTPMTNAGFTQIYIRGIGNSIYIGADPSVASFVDDVPRIYGSMADNLVDVERVEVLKGAQGGLYGRNSTGGVVNIVTRKPNLDAVEGNFRASYGEKNTFLASGYMNLPISDKVAFNFTVQRESHDPYVKNIARTAPYTAAMFPEGSFVGTPAETAAFFNAGISVPKLDDQDFWALRGKLLIQPTDDVSLVLAGDYYNKSDNNGSANVTLTPEFNRAALQQQFGFAGITAVLPAGFVQTPGKFEASIGAGARVHIREYGVSATLTWEAPGVTLSSISAVRNQSTDYVGGFGAEVFDFPINIGFEREFAYQEFRAVSTFDGPFRILGGFTYLNNRQDGDTRGAFLSPEIPGAITVAHNRVRNWSAYAQAGYDILPDLELTVSGRYMHETNMARFTLPVESSISTTQKQFIPSATLSYKLNGGNIYARWARGFKTGGVNLVTAPVYFPEPTDGAIFGPETVDTYEAGFKQFLLDRRLSLTGAVFYNDYRNIQADARALPAYSSTITFALINAESARTWGVEGSANLRVSPALSVGMNAGYLNARYKDFRLTGSTVLADFDLSGTQMPKAPKFQFGFNADLDQPLNDNLNLVSSLMVTHSASAIMQVSGMPGVLPDAVQPAYWLTNMRVGVKTADRKYSVALVADNLFNAEYFQYGLSNSLGNMLGYGRPRIIRAEFAFQF